MGFKAFYSYDIFMLYHSPHAERGLPWTQTHWSQRAGTLV